MVMDIRAKNLQPISVVRLIEHGADHGIAEMRRLLPTSRQLVERHMMLPQEVRPIGPRQRLFLTNHRGRHQRQHPRDACHAFGN
jgi:hypothetical protein